MRTVMYPGWKRSGVDPESHFEEADLSSEFDYQKFCF